MKIIKYDKLVRDKIPTIIEQLGKKVITEKVQGEDYLNHLNLKLEEELNEYKESNDIEELADIIEVIYGIVKYKGMTIEDFERIRVGKAKD